MIPVARPLLGDEEVQAAGRVIRSGMLASGPEVAAFEEEFAAHAGVTHAVAVSNGTTALHAALLGAGIGPGDEVIVPSFTFIATATAVSMCGAVPVFADVRPDLFTIDPDTLPDQVGPATRAVIGVHLFGQPFDVGPAADLCEERNLALIEDAAQAHGATWRGRRVGSLGTAGCFSFYPTKNMTTGEGGMVTTDDDALAGRLRRLVNHGQAEKYLHTSLGYNYRMTDIGGAIGRVQLRRLEEFNRRRQENAASLSARLDAPGIVPPAVGEGRGHVYHQYVVTVGDGCPLARDALAEHLRGQGVGCAVHYPIPVHEQPLYRDTAAPGACPTAADLARRVLSLPVHPALGPDDLDRIVEVVNGIGG
ncbi:MAG: DegT/DnrJ/EryC1/StrS family aminotransferase [Methanospirillum sp.]|nr:DegT/DnrJ/EryC1/StrS family aminotransferase [Methanospirillum sp.]